MPATNESLKDAIDTMRALRADLQAAIDSLDAGKGRQLDMSGVIKRARARYAKP
jgi:hypothetical protein